MNEEINLPDLNRAISKLNDFDEFKSVLAFIAQEKERCFADMRQAETPHDVMKLAGSIATLQELSEILSG